MASVKVSVLNPAARTKEGKTLSFEVVDQAELTPQLVASEGWSPVLFDRPRRASKNFLEASVVGFDIDENMSIEEAKEKYAHLRHIIGTTTNHQRIKNKGQSNERPACDRFRLILFLDQPVFSPEDYKESLLQLAAKFDIPFDEQAKDAARWFIPCREIVSVNLEGELVPSFEAKSPQQAQLAKSSVHTTLPVTTKGRLSKATRDFLAQESSDEGWHTRFIKASMDFKEQGYSVEEAASRLRAASPVFELDATDLQQLEDVYANRGGALEFRPAWPAMLPATKTQPARPNPTSIANQRYLLKEVLGYEFTFNSRREVIFYTHRDTPDKVELLNDPMLAVFNTAAREYGLSAGDSLRDLITTVAREKHFDPILDPLKALKWDGKEHIKGLFNTITLPKDVTPEAKQWYYVFLRRWLIGVVTKVFRPGSENNVLVFQGSQAAGKSRWLKRLAEMWPEGFGEGSINPDNKDHELRHLDNFIWHAAEFDTTTSRREVGALKDYFTKDTVNVRRPYSRLPIIGRSICSFCASVNSYEFLHDVTGNRRYLVIPVAEINADHKVDISQVLAEAKVAMEKGEPQWFTRAEIAEVNKLNEHYLSKEEYLEFIESGVESGEDLLSISQLMDEIGYSHIQLTRPIRSNIRTILEKKAIAKRTLSGTTKFLVNRGSLRGQRGQPSGLKLPMKVI